MSRRDDLDLPAHRLRELIGRKEISPRALVEQTFERIHRLDPVLNAYSALAEEAAKDAAAEAERAVARGDRLGPLHGLPVAVKDLADIRGLPTTMGSRAFRDNIADEDSLLVERLAGAGAIVVGKTTMHEFGNSCNGDGLLFGEINNPWDPSRVSGGSSGGSAAAIAAGMAALAHGSDGMGSIRVPASCCGVVGLKPSIGRVPSLPISGYETNVQHGPIARSALDCALMLDAIAGFDRRDIHSLEGPPGSFFEAARAEHDGCRRIAFSPTLGFNQVEEEVRAVVETAVELFARAEGAELRVVEAPISDPRAAEKVMWSTAIGYLGKTLSLQMGPAEDVDPHLRELVEFASGLSALDYFDIAIEFRNKLRGEMLDLFDQVDFLLTPTIGVVPFEHLGDAPGPAAINGVEVEPFSGWVFTYPFNLAGLPAISVPAGIGESGLPIGLQIVGPPRADADVLAAAHRFEQVSPFAGARPPLADLADSPARDSDAGDGARPTR